MGVWGLGFKVWGLRFRVLGFRIWGLGFSVLGFRVWGLGSFKVSLDCRTLNLRSLGRFSCRVSCGGCSFCQSPRQEKPSLKALTFWLRSWGLRFRVECLMRVSV